MVFIPLSVLFIQVFVDKLSDISVVVKSIRESSRIALDTEFVMDRQYYHPSLERIYIFI